MKRNHFLKLTGTLLMCQPFSVAAGALTSMRNLPANKLHRSMFENHLQTKFSIYREDGTRVDAKLEEVSDGFLRKHPTPQTLREKQFSLLFRLPSGSTLEQDTYKFYHPGIGHFEIFVTQTMWNRSMNYCEAVFN